MKSIVLIASLIALTVAPVSTALSADPDALRSTRAFIDLWIKDWTPDKGYELARQMEVDHFGTKNLTTAEMLYMRGAQCGHKPSIKRLSTLYDDWYGTDHSFVMNLALFEAGLIGWQRVQELSAKARPLFTKPAWKSSMNRFRRLLKQECNL